MQLAFKIVPHCYFFPKFWDVTMFHTLGDSVTPQQISGGFFHCSDIANCAEPKKELQQ